MSLHPLQVALRAIGNPDKVEHSKRFFKTGPNQYGFGDEFLGITVPEQRKIAKQFSQISLEDLWKVLYSPLHEERLTSLIILTEKYAKATVEEKKQIVHGYLEHKAQINNWDLVDSSAHKILGEHLMYHPNEHPILTQLAGSQNLWDRRIAMVSTWAFIQAHQYDLPLSLSKMLLQDQEDLMHKAVGWMLREMGKHGGKRELEDFLKKFAAKMPRTMLRYAIEHFTSEQRAAYLAIKN